MASRLPKYSLIALGLAVTFAMSALGGAALAGGTRGQANVSLPPASDPGTLRTDSESEATDQSATEEDAVEPATNEDPAASEEPVDEPSSDEPSGDADEEPPTDDPQSE